MRRGWWPVPGQRQAARPGAFGALAAIVVPGYRLPPDPGCMSLPGCGATVPAPPARGPLLGGEGGTRATGLMLEAARLHLSIPAPLNRRPKRL
jgi:hypothetical protein